jgi:hypothetical protein
MPPRGTTPRAPRPARKAVRKDGSVVHVHYTPEVAEQICERIANGEIWYRFCNTDGLPSYRSLYVWVKRYPEFAEAYAQAQEIAAHARFEKALVVAEDATAATVSADRLHVSTLLRHAAALAPLSYGSERRGGRAAEPPATIILQQYRRDPLGGPAIPIFDVTPTRIADAKGDSDGR